MKQQHPNLLHGQTIRKSVSFERGLQTRIANLKQERELLEEEVRQLRAAVQVYTEVARRLSATTGVPDTSHIPLLAA